MGKGPLVSATAAAEPGQFIATPEKGAVSSLLLRPVAAQGLLVLGHGASTSMHHRILEAITTVLAAAGVATFRYHFPFMERGGRGRDSQATSLATVRAAVAAGHAAAALRRLGDERSRCCCSGFLLRLLLRRLLPALVRSCSWRSSTL